MVHTITTLIKLTREGSAVIYFSVVHSGLSFNLSPAHLSLTLHQLQVEKCIMHTPVGYPSGWLHNPWRLKEHELYSSLQPHCKFNWALWLDATTCVVNSWIRGWALCAVDALYWPNPDIHFRRDSDMFDWLVYYSVFSLYSKTLFLVFSLCQPITLPTHYLLHFPFF